MISLLFWTGRGVYVPEVNEENFVEWWMDETGDPLVGVQVDSTDNASRFAEVEYPAWWLEQGTLFRDGELQRMIDEGEQTAEYIDWLIDIEWLREGC